MIWRYFPVGFRFPVPDFTDETKRGCWETALSALTASGGSGATLYDAQEHYDVGTGGSVYLCIACFYGIKQSRAVAKQLYARDRLMSTLCLHRPFLQANDLESFGPYPILGTLKDDGIVETTEAGAAFLPERAEPMPINDGMKLLVAAQPNEDGEAAEAFTRAIGDAAANAGFQTVRVPLADGAKGLITSLVTAQNGRYETLRCMNGNGERVSETIGILPGPVAVLTPANDQTDLLKSTVDAGYRSLLVWENSFDAPEGCTIAAFRDAQSSDTEASERFLDRISFDARVDACEFAVLIAPRCTALTEVVLERLNAAQTPAVLISADPEADEQTLMRKYTVLRGVVQAPADTSALETAFREEVQKRIERS